MSLLHFGLPVQCGWSNTRCGARGEGIQGPYSSSMGSLSTAGIGGTAPGLDLAQISTSGKTDLRSCFRETSKHVSSQMSSSSEIKPCSLATAEGSQWQQYLFSFWALQIVLGKRKIRCIARKKELLSMQQRNHTVPDSHNSAIHSALYLYKRTDLGFVTVLVNQFWSRNLNPNSSQVTLEKWLYFICTKSLNNCVPLCPELNLHI